MSSRRRYGGGLPNHSMFTPPDREARTRRCPMEIGGQIGSDADAVNADLVRERSGHGHFQRGL
jgi:hypothetical protein